LPSSQRRFLSINKWVTHTHTHLREGENLRDTKKIKNAHTYSPHTHTIQKKKKTLDPISTLGPTNIKKKIKPTTPFGRLS
jgi:hypothetical protein